MTPPARPDAATWAREEIIRLLGNHFFLTYDEVREGPMGRWLVPKLLTLHAQAVEQVLTDNNLEWIATARQKEKEAVDAAVRDYRDALKTIRDSVRNDSDLRAMRITHLVNQALGEPDDSELHRAGPGFTRPT